MMDEKEDAPEQLRGQLRHPHLRERRKALQKIEKRLQAGQDRLEMRALLLEFIEAEPALTLREAAQAVVNRFFPAPKPFFAPEDARHMFQATCLNGHTLWYDRRECCGKKGTTYMGNRDRGGVCYDELILRCPQNGCGVEFIWEVDCEGYR